MLTIVNALGLSFFSPPRRARMKVEPIFISRIVTASQDPPSRARLEVEPIFK